MENNLTLISIFIPLIIILFSYFMMNIKTIDKNKLITSIVVGFCSIPLVRIMYNIIEYEEDSYVWAYIVGSIVPYVLFFLMKKRIRRFNIAIIVTTIIALFLGFVCAEIIEVISCDNRSCNDNEVISVDTTCVDTMLVDELAVESGIYDVDEDEDYVEIISTWEMTTQVGREFIHNYMQIYKSEGVYYSRGESESPERLIKRSNKYYIDGAKYGDYYLVSGDKIFVYDKDGLVETICGRKVDDSEYVD